ncbi:type II CRISPR-associated endonuclease Cas1 [Boudabousia marimammalium]|uniref:CRISPR-associated endonuclease Cas1 n=1 Tax=Boudabousia marimammalium TaxID=156892 RepID=A0A1Q5PL18_9ACTO|nr:type II CRISPR-associated endonuclease Cas1 [Boudabousia marimammalium]OKL47335.1 subtype II CRISPR-associated endonuclease Cas1 [Boudabousia marimammalium]
MKSGWRIIDLLSMEGSIGYKYGNLVVRPSDKPEVMVPLADVAVVLLGVRVTISGAALMKLSDHDASVLVCDWRGIPCAGAYPWSDHSRIAARHNAQASLSQPRRKQAWAAIVKAKILGQAHTVSLCSELASKRLVEIAKSVRSGDPENCEAQAARLYWGAISPFDGFRREPGSGGDDFNKCLDYAYTVLRGHGIRSVVGAGLCGPIGLFHHSRSNPFALVDDVIEPFRPAIDYALLTTLESYDVSQPEVKQQLVAASTQTFNKEGQSLTNCLDSFCQSLGLFVEDDLDSLPVPVWK